MDTLTVVPPPTTDPLARVRAGLDALPAAQRQIGKTEFSMWDAQILALARAFRELPGGRCGVRTRSDALPLVRALYAAKAAKPIGAERREGLVPSGAADAGAQHDGTVLKNVKEVAVARSGAGCSCFLQPHQS